MSSESETPEQDEMRFGHSRTKLSRHVFHGVLGGDSTLVLPGQTACLGLAIHRAYSWTIKYQNSKALDPPTPHEIWA
jgi:TctA family transporter